LSEDIKRALDFVSNKLVSDIVLEGIRFDSSILKKIVDRAEGLLKADVKPVKRGKRARPDKISLKDRTDVASTDDWIYFSDEPLEAVKVKVPSLDQEARVGFNKGGVVTILNRNFSEEMYLRTLKYLVEQIINSYRLFYIYAVSQGISKRSLYEMTNTPIKQIRVSEEFFWELFKHSVLSDILNGEHNEDALKLLERHVRLRTEILLDLSQEISLE